MYKLLDDKIVYLLDGLVKGEVCFKIKNENLSMFVGLFAFVRAKNMISKKYKNSKFQP